MRYRGTPCKFFWGDVTTKLQRVHIFNETQFKIPSIDLYCIKMNLKQFYPSPHLQNCLTSARLKFRKGSGFSGKCQTHLKNFSRKKLSSGWQTKVQERFRLFWQVPDTSEEFLQKKVEFWVAIMFCFFWIFIEFYQVPDFSGKCQTKGF